LSSSAGKRANQQVLSAEDVHCNANAIARTANPFWNPGILFRHGVDTVQLKMLVVLPV